MSTTPLFRRACALMAAAVMSGAVYLPALGGLAIAAGPSTSQGFQISPPVTTLALDRGTSTRQTIKITNLTDSQLNLTVSKRNFAAKGEEGEVELTSDTEGDPRYNLGPYFSVSQPNVTVPPRGTSTVNYALSVPKDAEPGGRYGSVVFTTSNGQLAPGQSGARVTQQLAALVFLRVNGEANDQISIESFQAGKQSGTPSKTGVPTINTFAEYGPVTFLTRVRNSGNVHEQPTGTIVIKNFLGFKTDEISVDSKSDGRIVIPGSIRRLQNNLNRKWLFGRYTAQLTLKNGSIQTLSAKTAFTVIPYRVVAAVLIGLIILFFLVFKGRRRFSRAIRILAGKE